MTHVEQGELQAYLDAEVSGSARAHIEQHLAGCGNCAAELAALRSAASIFATAMRGVDAPAPVFAALAAVRANAAPVAVARPRFSRVPLARAAMLVLGLGAVAAAAVPGSPVRAWIADAIRSVTGARPAATPAPAPAVPAVAQPAEAPAAGAALSIEPVDGRVRVVLTDVSDDAVIRVRLVDDTRASVNTSGAAARARFRTGAGRIEVVGVERGEVLVELPRTGVVAQLVVGGKVVYLKDQATADVAEFVVKP